MLFYLSLRERFHLDAGLAAVQSRDARGSGRGSRGMPASARTAEDWLTLAEVSLSYDGKQAAPSARANRRARFGLSPSQKARLDLIDALIAGAENRYRRGGAAVSGGPRRGSTPKRRAIALYGGYFARALADPNRVEAAAGGCRAAALCGARRSLDRRFPEGHSGSDRQSSSAPRRAIRTTRRCRPIARSWRILHRRPRAGEGGDRAVARHRSGRPDRAGGARQLQGRDRERSRGRPRRPDPRAKIAPGSTTIWNALGIVLKRARRRRARPRPPSRRSIELDPQRPGRPRQPGHALSRPGSREGGQARDRQGAGGRSVLRHRAGRARTLLPADRRDWTRRWRTCWPDRPPIRPIRRRFCCSPPATTKAATASRPSRRSKTPTGSIRTTRSRRASRPRSPSTTMIPTARSESAQEIAAAGACPRRRLRAAQRQPRRRLDAQRRLPPAGAGCLGPLLWRRGVRPVFGRPVMSTRRSRGSVNPFVDDLELRQYVRSIPTANNSVLLVVLPGPDARPA